MFAKLKTKLQGWRTSIGASAIGLVGALQLIGAVDISPLLRLFVKDENMIGAILVVVAVGGGIMRYLTTTPIGTSAPPAVAPPSAPTFNRGVDAGT